MKKPEWLYHKRYCFGVDSEPVGLWRRLSSQFNFFWRWRMIRQYLGGTDISEIKHRPRFYR